MLSLQDVPSVTAPDCTLSLCPYTHAAVESQAAISVGPHEIPELCMGLCDRTTSSIDARLVAPSASSLCITRVPSDFYADRPLTIQLAVAGLCVDAPMAASVAAWLSMQILLHITVDKTGRPCSSYTVPVSVHPSRGGGWIARAIIRPSAWADAASVTVVSLSLAGRPLHSDCLPATMRVGNNHAMAPAGAVFAAAEAGDVAALQAALDAGGSTEEASRVRVRRAVGACCAPFCLSRSVAPCLFVPLLFSAAGRLDWRSLGRPRRPPRGSPHAPGGWRQPKRSRRGEDGVMRIMHSAGPLRL